MDLNKAKKLILSTRKAVFIPEPGAPLSGRYAWFKGKFFYLHFDGVNDEIQDFWTLPKDQLNQLPFLNLMQKHLISTKKVPSFISERVYKLDQDYLENIRLIQEKQYILEVEPREFLAFDPVMKFFTIQYERTWKVSPYFHLTKQKLIKRLWKKPGLQMAQANREVVFFTQNYLEKSKEKIQGFLNEEYLLSRDQQVIFYLKELDEYFWCELEEDQSLAKRVYLDPFASCIPPGVFVEILINSNTQDLEESPGFHQKKIPPSFKKELKKLTQTIKLKSNVEPLIQEVINKLREGERLSVDFMPRLKWNVSFEDKSFWLSAYENNSSSIPEIQQREISKAEIKELLSHYLVYHKTFPETKLEGQYKKRETREIPEL